MQTANTFLILIIRFRLKAEIGCKTQTEHLLQHTALLLLPAKLQLN